MIEKIRVHVNVFDGRTWLAGCGIQAPHFLDDDLLCIESTATPDGNVDKAAALLAAADCLESLAENLREMSDNHVGVSDG